MQEPTYHYFVSSFDIWTTGSDLLEVLTRHKKNSKAETATVFWVPLPERAAYEIRNYQPKVDGVVGLDVIGLNAKGRKVADEHRQSFIDFFNSPLRREEV